MPTFLITTATGRQGGSTVRILRAKGHTVHRRSFATPLPPPALALKSLGAKLFKGDFDDVPAITTAMQGVAVFLSPYPSFTDPNTEMRAAKRCPVRSSSSFESSVS
jgi:uncharacterized protein YbjT (DUF2867 family)